MTTKFPGTGTTRSPDGPLSAGPRDGVVTRAVGLEAWRSAGLEARLGRRS